MRLKVRYAVASSLYRSTASRTAPPIPSSTASSTASPSLHLLTFSLLRLGGIDLQSFTSGSKNIQQTFSLLRLGRIDLQSFTYGSNNTQHISYHSLRHFPQAPRTDSVPAGDKCHKRATCHRECVLCVAPLVMRYFAI